MNTRSGGDRKRIIRDDEDEPAVKEEPQQQNSQQQQQLTAQQQQQNQIQARAQAQAQAQSQRLAALRQVNFAETSEALLKKYANEPASMELHIHHTHYRFGNQEGVLPKNSPLVKILMEYIQSESIPPAAAEVFRDSGIRFYEGCIIIKLIDHRNVPQEVPKSKAETEAALASTNSDDKSDGNSNNNSSTNGKPEPEPVTHRAILKPTSLSLYHDLLYTTDTSQNKFTDQLALMMETEILALSVRNVDLSVPQNPYKSMVEVPQRRPRSTSMSKEESRALFDYKEPVAKKHRGLHEDMVHHATDYEDLMLIMDDMRANNHSTTNTGGQFMRLSFIEQMRKKKERQRQQQTPAPAQQQQAQNQSQNPQQQQQQQQQQLQQPQQVQQNHQQHHQQAQAIQQQQQQQQARMQAQNRAQMQAANQGHNQTQVPGGPGHGPNAQAGMGMNMSPNPNVRMSQYQQMQALQQQRLQAQQQQAAAAAAQHQQQPPHGAQLQPQQNFQQNNQYLQQLQQQQQQMMQNRAQLNNGYANSGMSPGPGTNSPRPTPANSGRR